MCELKLARCSVEGARYCHTLTGVWVEILNRTFGYRLTGVTPSRVCELKSLVLIDIKNSLSCHTLTGVWVEISSRGLIARLKIGHTLTGVWVEISKTLSLKWSACVTPSRVCELKWISYNYVSALGSHTLTGVWVEMRKKSWKRQPKPSHPHGCVSWNTPFSQYSLYSLGHTLTGVWVEIYHFSRIQRASTVTPSRVCELK